MKKKLLIILVLCCGLILVGCNNKTTKKDKNEPKKEEKTKKDKKDKKESNSIVGQWEYEEGYFVYTFNEDKTGSYEAQGSGLKFTYAINGNKITFTYDDNKLFETEFRIEGNTLIVKDSGGQELKYIKK